jgi:hypothetical protein
MTIFDRYDDVLYNFSMALESFKMLDKALIFELEIPGKV